MKEILNSDIEEEEQKIELNQDNSETIDSSLFSSDND